jgi:hypothetical protein
VLVPVSGLIFGWDLALELLELIGVVGGVATLVRLLGRGLPRIVRQVLGVALIALAVGLVVGWEQAEVLVASAGVFLIWQRSSERERLAS